MSFIPFTEKNWEKKLQKFTDPDPHQNKADPNHRLLVLMAYNSYFYVKVKVVWLDFHIN